jgi:hypothetical protein
MKIEKNKKQKNIIYYLKKINKYFFILRVKIIIKNIFDSQ